ncbi:MAG: CpsD/CapB family tyrosine-protein kinase [Candidatus Omnitrophica bacterium]|nr:CpsD/CapB family tyrosine-protein kinase [Candidatus Omnitrophota bacterium]
MSKFTKALEKLQDLKQEETEPGRPLPAFSVPDTEPDRRPSWIQGVSEVKNTVPEHSIVTHHFQNSLIAEQYRILRMNLKTNLDKERAQVILVSSSIHNEGKTVTAANLAMSLAESGDAKVALIDGDLRRGRVADYLGLGGKRQGLHEFLADTNGLSPKKVMFRNAKENLVIMPRGEALSNPSGLISSNRFKILIAELRNHFDYIVIDSPPIMAVADAGILSHEADGVLMIIQLGRTPKSIVAHSNMLFKQAGAKMLGYVLTNVEFQTSEYRYDYGYSYNYKPGEQEGAKQRIRRRVKVVGERLQGFENRLAAWWEKKLQSKK